MRLKELISFFWNPPPSSLAIHNSFKNWLVPLSLSTLNWFTEKQAGGQSQLSSRRLNCEWSLGEIWADDVGWPWDCHMAGTNNIDPDIELQVLRGISENEKQSRSLSTITWNFPGERFEHQS